MHHAYADTENDPHSPTYDETIWNMMWKTKTIYSQLANKTMKVDKRFTEGVPDWASFDRFARSWTSRLLWAAVYTGVYVAFAPSPWFFLLLPIHFLMSPIHGAIINWFAHKYGYRNFEVRDTSKNFLPFDFLMMGESYHNNHHKHGSRANFGGIRWHEIDPTYLVIRVLSFCGVIQFDKQRKMNVEQIKKAA
jgi:stearoyl-CoA desaturase (delta-9 desaturase)